jgi:GT2 family glycosyltransferase
MTDKHPSSSTLVYVVTLTWNQKEDTLSCLDSLVQMRYPHIQLLLVDNGSVDGTVEAVRKRFPDVEIIVNPSNLGFAGGFNVGMRHALAQGADFVFIINNDTFVEPNILDELLAYAAPPDVGMLAPKIFYADDPNRIWSLGGKRHPLTLEMTAKADGQMDDGQWDRVLEQDYLVGCALLVKRQLLEEVGLFDTGYRPIYYEDVDYSLRARQAGYRLLLVPTAHMWHKVSASGGGSGSPRERYLMALNSVRFFRKHVRGWRWLVVVPYRLGSAIKTTIRLLVQGRTDSVLSYWRGLRDGFAVSTAPGDDELERPDAVV